MTDFLIHNRRSCARREFFCSLLTGHARTSSTLCTLPQPCEREPVPEMGTCLLCHLDLEPRHWSQVDQQLSDLLGHRDPPPPTAETYTGLTKNTFKQRYNGHKTNFRNKKHEHETTLSSHIWKLQDAGADYSIELSIIDNGRKFDPNTRKCMLCLKEKYHILFNPAGASLNQKSELFSVCRHRLENLLVNT